MRLVGQLSIVAAFSFCIQILGFQAGFAQKLVDPNAVAPEYREAAMKRRAEQMKQRECAQKADAAKVLPRDRTAMITQCLESDGPATSQ
ncbi:MAG TPA: hypothetical protein VN926_21045 [Bradyrhizobium sp.]|jgi:hypothetical protein|nr:hypothetical protein [Bradyrhizobium sp.]